MERVAIDPLEVPGPGRRLVSRVVVTDRIPIVSSESNCLNCSLTAPWGFAMFTRPPASYSGPGPPPIPYLGLNINAPMEFDIQDQCCSDVQLCGEISFCSRISQCFVTLEKNAAPSLVFLQISSSHDYMMRKQKACTEPWPCRSRGISVAWPQYFR